MITLQRIIIEKKGVKTIEELKKQRKLYFDVLVNIAEKSGVKISNLEDLEILKTLRNKVEHEGHRPSKENALWAYKTAKAFISQHYPAIFESAQNEYAGTCPRCGSPLKWRRARLTGELYRGCTNYPKCKYHERSYKYTPKESKNDYDFL